MPNVDYSLSVSGDAVQLRAVRALSFEPKGWQIAARDQLRAALETLSREGGLHVRFWDADRRIDDLENAVVYNIGPSHLKDFLPDGLWLQRVDAPFGYLDPDHRALYEYRSLPLLNPVALPAEGVVFRDLDLDHPRTVLEVWRAARQSRRADEAALDGRLGIRVIGGRFSASEIKPMLDGLVASLHQSLSERTSNILRQWGVTEAEIADLREEAPLGEREVVKLVGRNGVAWDPADDLFDEIVLCPDDSPAARVVVYRLTT